MRADPTPTYGGQNALGWANERGDDASAQLLIELHMVAEEEQRASFLALQHGDSAVLERAPARPLRLLRPRLVALGSSALPMSAQPQPRVLELAACKAADFRAV